MCKRKVPVANVKSKSSQVASSKFMLCMTKFILHAISHMVEL